MASSPRGDQWVTSPQRPPSSAGSFGPEVQIQRVREVLASQGYRDVPEEVVHSIWRSSVEEAERSCAASSQAGSSTPLPQHTPQRHPHDPHPHTHPQHRQQQQQQQHEDHHEQEQPPPRPQQQQPYPEQEPPMAPSPHLPPQSPMRSATPPHPPTHPHSPAPLGPPSPHSREEPRPQRPSRHGYTGSSQASPSLVPSDEARRRAIREEEFNLPGRSRPPPRSASQRSTSRGAARGRSVEREGEGVCRRCCGDCGRPREQMGMHSPRGHRHPFYNDGHDPVAQQDVDGWSTGYTASEPNDGVPLKLQMRMNNSKIRQSVIYVPNLFDHNPAASGARRPRPATDPVAKHQRMLKRWNADPFLSQKGRSKIMWATRADLLQQKVPAQ